MNQTTIKTARGMAIVGALIMLQYFVAQNQKVFDSENPFMVPDVSFAIMLAVSALLPVRIAVAAMTLSFSFAAGVISVSFFNHLAENDRFDVGNLALLIGLLVGSALMTRVIIKGKSSKNA